MSNQHSPFLCRVREAIRVRHYSIRTEQAYLTWVRQFILFHAKHNPEDMGSKEVGEFLTYLAVSRQVAPSTQNQALNALVFLHDKMLKKSLGHLAGVVRAERKQRIPVVLAVNEVSNYIG